MNSGLKQLRATDRDIGDNGRQTYSILQTVLDESKGMFSIDSTSGMVTLKKPLDREKVAEHVVYVKARDSGMPQLAGKRLKRPILKSRLIVDRKS